MWIIFLVGLLKANQITHLYSEGEQVVLWFNKLVPFDNPQESYAYTHLPLCIGERKEKIYLMGLGEAIEGYELQDSGIEIKFTKEATGQNLCSIALDNDKKTLITQAIKRNFWLQMYFDDLPMWTALGEYNEESDMTYIYTHYTFYISYNNDRVILAKPSFQRPVNLASSEKIQFSYSVVWIQTDVKFSERFSSYLDPGFFENNIHWFSIINSFVMVVLLCSLVILILYRTVSKDYDRYNAQEIEANEFVEAKGWKQVAGDVFKAPDYLPFFACAVSCGWHLAIVTLFGIFTSILHPMYSERGSLSYYLLVEYALFGIVAGGQFGAMYTQYKGKRWVGSSLLASAAFPCFLTVISCLLNFIAVIYSSSAAIPLFTFLEIIALILFVYFPLFLLGLLLGKRYRAKRPTGHRVNSIQSPILKEKNIYNHPLILVFCGGILPFSSIYVEVYYVFTSFWNYKFYYVYGFTLMTFVLFALSVGCVAIVATYSILNSEDHRWHWVSFGSSASVGLYLYVYAAYYYLFKTKMSGTFQFFFYFAYMIISSTYLALVAGAIGYTASYYFVQRIYSNIKFE